MGRGLKADLKISLSSVLIFMLARGTVRDGGPYPMACERKTITP